MVKRRKIDNNTEVLKKSDSVSIVNQAPRNVRSAAEFLPCQFCLLFFVLEFSFHAGGAHSAPPDSLAGFEGGKDIAIGTIGEEKEGRKGNVQFQTVASK